MTVWSADAPRTRAARVREDLGLARYLLAHYAAAARGQRLRSHR